jgi:hypothetical protein
MSEEKVFLTIRIRKSMRVALKEYSESNDKSVTQVIKDFIEKLVKK